MREPTIRKQNIHRNHLKIRLIFFGILALALVIASYFSEYLCPYDPYLQDLGNAKAVPSAAHIFGTDRYGRDMLSRVIAGCIYYSAGYDDRSVLCLEGNMGGYCVDAYFRCIPCLPGAGVCAGGSGSSWRWCP